jgi:signal transduction histidine kinase
MIAVFFVYGLAFFSLSLAVGLESRRVSSLPLGRWLPWLAAFGFVHSAVEWIDMFRLINSSGAIHDVLTGARGILLPISALLLVRFGIGLVNEAGPLPEWLTLLPIALLVPAGLLIAYAVIVALTESPAEIAVDVWSRYLLYLPGNLLAAFGFIRQGRGLTRTGWDQARRLLLGAGLAFGVNALVAGLVVPTAPYGLAPWINYEVVKSMTGVPVQVWRMLSAVAVTLFVVRALGVFEAERAHRLAALNAEREQAQTERLTAQRQARETAETWIAALVDINRRIAELENIDQVLIEIVQRARALLHSDLAALGLWDATRSNLLLKAYALADRVEAGMNLPVHREIIVAAAAEHTAHCIHVASRDLPTPWHCSVLNGEVQAAALVPLCLNDEPLGVMWTARTRNESFNEVERLGLEQLADQAVIAIEHAMLTQRLQSLAVTEERGRIAREMHDGLAQILGYLSLETQTLDALVRGGDRERALEELRQARARIHEAQADVRENILSLRTTLAGDVGLVQALRQYVEEFSVQTGIDAELISEVDIVHGLSPLAETQLVRVVQEALANVRKHARAQHTQVRLSMRGDCLNVAVADDGIGLNGEAERNHFGLQMMRERAEGVGGGLTISSQPGEGTQVELWLPLLHQRN